MMPRGTTGPILILALLLLLPACGSKQVKAAKEFMDAGMYQEAIPLLELEIQSDPKNAEAHFLVGQCHLGMGQLGKAKEPFERAILVETGYREEVAAALVETGLAALEKEGPGRSFTYLDAAAEYDPTGSKDLAADLRKRGRELAESSPETKPAMALLDKSLQLDPGARSKVAEIYFDVGKLLIDKGFDEAGFAYVEKSIKLDPGHLGDVAGLYFERGRDLLRQDPRSVNAGPWLGRAMQLDKKNISRVAGEYREIAQDHEKKDDLRLAYQFATRSAELDAGQARYLAELLRRCEESGAPCQGDPEIASIVAHGVDFDDGSIGEWNSLYPNPSFDDEAGRSGTPNARWRGSYTIDNERLCLRVDDLEAPNRPGHAIGVGYTVTLRHASFEDGEQTKSFVLHKYRRYPSKRSIQECYPIVPQFPRLLASH